MARYADSALAVATNVAIDRGLYTGGKPATDHRPRAKVAARFFVIYADGAFDQIAEGERAAKRERRDLERMGFKVRVNGPMTGAQADALSDAR